MLNQPLGFYVGLYLSGVVLAIFIHKLYFALHPEYKLENIEQHIHDEKYNPCVNALEQGRLHGIDEDGDMFTPMSDESLKMLIWLSWFAVAIWLLAFCLTILGVVSNGISNFLKVITDKIL